MSFIANFIRAALGTEKGSSITWTRPESLFHMVRDVPRPIPVAEIEENPLDKKVRFPHNPKNLNWGCVVVIRNRQLFFKGNSFDGLIDLKEKLIQANRVVLRRPDKHNAYEVQIHYGMTLNEYFSRNP